METIMDDLLRWSPERVAALQVERLRTTIAQCYEFHPYYRDLMRRVGLTPDDIGNLDDLERFPVTTKADFVADPEKFRLQLDGGPLEDRILAKLMYTTGSTTGVPAVVYATASDHFDYILRCRRRRDFIDLRQGDLVVSLFPLTPFPMGAYARTTDEVSTCGGAVLFTDPGHAPGPVTPHRRLDEVVELVVANQPTVLWGISSFVLRFLRRVGDGGGRLERLRMVMMTGERSSPQLVADLGAAMEAVGASGRTVVNRYGSTEQGSSMVECTPGSGFHDLAPDSVFMEVLDPSTGRRLPDGEEGSLAFTHLNRTGTVLLRFAVGDLAAISHDPCPHCGRTGSARLVSGPVRSGDVVKVKGILVNLSGVGDRLAEMDGVRDYQVVLERDRDQDVMTVRVAASGEPTAELGGRVGALVQSVAHITPQVELVSDEELVRGIDGGKFARIVDRRPSEGCSATAFDGVDQLVVFTPDVDRALRLYRDHLGFSVVSQEDVDARAWGTRWRLPDIPDPLGVTLLDKPGSRGGGIRLVDVPGMPPAAPREFASDGLFAFDFYVRDLPGLWEELRSDGFRFKSEPLTYAMPGASNQITECLLEGPQGIWHSFISYLPGAHRCLLASEPEERVSEVVAVVQIVGDGEGAIGAVREGLGGRTYYDQVFGDPTINQIVGLPDGSSFRVVLLRGATSRNARIELMSPISPSGTTSSAAGPALLSIRVEHLDEQLATLRSAGIDVDDAADLRADFAGGDVRVAVVDLGQHIRVELLERLP